MIVRGVTDRNAAGVLMVVLPALLGFSWISWLGMIFGWPLLVTSWLCEEHGDESGMRIGIALTAIWWGWLLYHWAS